MKTVWFSKVVRAIENPMEFVVEETCLARYGEKLDFLIGFYSRY